MFEPGYLAGWVHREITDLLDAFVEAVERRLSPRLMIFLPPRAGKSLIVSKNFPSFTLGKHPEWDIITTTYGQDLADDFGRAVRATLNDPLYAEVFPNTVVDRGSNAADRMDTTQRGSYRAVGRGGSLTGRGAHILIVDDPLKDRQEADSETTREHLWKWYTAVARTRLAPGGGIIICQTRWHEDDLAGRLELQQKQDPNSDQWHTYKYAALAPTDELFPDGTLKRKEGDALHPERFDAKELRRIRASLTRGTDIRDWEALYQQNPIPADGNFFQRSDLQIKDAPTNTYTYISTDFAVSEKSTADFTVLAPFCVDSTGNVYFDKRLVRKRLSALDAIEALLDLAEQTKPLGVFIEKGVISKAIMPMLRKRMLERQVFFSIHEKSPSKDKQSRATPLQALCQQRMVYLPDTPLTQEVIIPELLAFPAGKHDDVVDAMAWAALMISDKIITPSDPRPVEPPLLVDPANTTWDQMRKRCQDPFSEKTTPSRSLFAHLKKPKEPKW